MINSLVIICHNKGVLQMSNRLSACRITKMLMLETGTYNPQYRRPYETNLHGSTLNMFKERLDTVDKYVPSLIAGIANQFISPAATPEKQIAIVNGWNERRVQFMMEIEYTYQTGGSTTQVILGYTDHVGITVAGAIDPNMQFYVNSVLQIRNTIQNTPLGSQLYTSVSDSSHVLIDNNWGGIYSEQSDQRMRPEDVFSTMSRTHLVNLGGVSDYRSTNNNMPAKSSRKNNLAANYASDILSNYKQASLSEEFGQGNNEILNTARGYVGEQVAARDPFLSAMAGIQGQPLGNTFTFDNLRRLDPNVDNVTHVNLMLPTQQATAHQAGQTADWGGTTRETQVATILSQSVPSLLMELALTKITFRSTNRDFSNAVNTQVFNPGGFSNNDQSNSLRIFIARLEHEILKDISFDNQVDYAIEMHVDLLGETWIKLSMDGKAFVDYVTPSFCDALTVPVLTAVDQVSVNLASDFQLLAGELSNSNSSYNNPSVGNGSNTKIFGTI